MWQCGTRIKDQTSTRRGRRPQWSPSKADQNLHYLGKNNMVVRNTTYLVLPPPVTVVTATYFNPVRNN
jgi:hypothetical protein